MEVHGGFDLQVPPFRSVLFGGSDAARLPVMNNKFKPVFTPHPFLVRPALEGDKQFKAQFDLTPNLILDMDFLDGSLYYKMGVGIEGAIVGLVKSGSLAQPCEAPQGTKSQVDASGKLIAYIDDAEDELAGVYKENIVNKCVRNSASTN
ncbi:hypothetical protein HK102_005944 [Quaeritorhiza haematococci]|nr:hypothetical protein HK102_005944 [Quaeritorhiza haematococci]